MDNLISEPDADVRLRCRGISSYDELVEASALYQRVFGYGDPAFALNPNLLTAMARFGGSAVGVFAADDVLVGFAYGFAGVDEQGASFHYSQAATVDAAYQGRGIGRMLKRAQRDVALHWGQSEMRWTFDPVLARNAYFNLRALGAVGVQLVPDYYGRPRTDRLVVSWDLKAPHTERPLPEPPQLTSDDWGQIRPGAANAGAVWVALSARGEATDEVRTRLSDALAAVLAEGRILVDCVRIDEHTAAYLAVDGGSRA